MDYLNVKEVKEGFGSKTKIALAIAGGVLAMVAFSAISSRCEEIRGLCLWVIAYGGSKPLFYLAF
jgi:hypothetical protein